MAYAAQGMLFEAIARLQARRLAAIRTNLLRLYAFDLRKRSLGFGAFHDEWVQDAFNYTDLAHSHSRHVKLLHRNCAGRGQAA